MSTWLIPGLCPANERRRYKVTPSLIGRAQTHNQPCVHDYAPKLVPNTRGESDVSWYDGHNLGSSGGFSAVDAF